MENNYFTIEGLNIQYPIYVTINGRKWNFCSEYKKKVNSLSVDSDHKLFNLLIDTGFFQGERYKIFKNIPILVTDDIRVKGDKRTYYIVDYLMPGMNLAFVVTNKIEKSLKTPKVKYLKTTLYNIGYDVIELNELNEMESLANYMNGLRNSIYFRTVPETLVSPKYFK